MSRFKRLGIVALLTYLLPALAEDVVELKTIDVTFKKDLSLFNCAIHTSISSAELEALPLATVANRLTDIPGVVGSQNGGPGGRMTFFFRGTESRHVAFTLDGLKLNDPSNTDRQFDSAFFTSPLIDEINIFKGPQAVLFGSDSLGGIVEMITRKGGHAPETRFSLNGGSFGTFDSSLSHDWKSSENQRGTLTATRFHSNGISRLNKKRFNAKEADSTDIYQLTSSSSHQWSSNLGTEFLISNIRGENELDGSKDDNSFDRSINDQILAQQKSLLKLSSRSAFSLRNGLNHNYRKIRTLAIGKEIYNGNLIQNEGLFHFTSNGVNFLGGVSSDHEDFNLATTEKSFDLHSLFAQFSKKQNRFKFQSGLRADQHIRYGQFYTGSGGVSYIYHQSILSIQYSQGYKAPSLYQLYAPPLLGSTIGNPNLVPEVNKSWELGWSFLGERVESEMVFFQNRLSNLISYSSSIGYINQSRFMAEGVEGSLKFKERSYHLVGGAMIQDFKNEQSTVLRRPYSSLNGGISLFPSESTEVNLKGRWFNGRRDLGKSGQVVKLNSFEVLDFGLRKKIGKADFGIQFLNILNRTYEELYGFSVMPRSVFFHFGQTF